jgi:hypothetical protein
MASPNFISIGHRCLSATAIKRLGLKKESYPFDWNVSKLPVVQHCIETNFSHFMNLSHYKTVETVVLSTDKEVEYAKGSYPVNMYYEKKFGNLEEKERYKLQLAFQSKNILNKKENEYYVRCIQRWNDVLSSNDPKILVYSHPVCFETEFTSSFTEWLHMFESFRQFIQARYPNVTLVCFLCVLTNRHHTTKIYDHGDMMIYKLESSVHQTEEYIYFEPKMMAVLSAINATFATPSKTHPPSHSSWICPGKTPTKESQAEFVRQ